MIQKSMAMSGTTANYTLAESLRNMLSNKMFRVFIALLCAALFSSIALAGGDDGALGEIWTQLSEALSGAPGKATAACMLISAFYFSIGRPNPGLALVSFLMMMILANGEKSSPDSLMRVLCFKKIFAKRAKQQFGDESPLFITCTIDSMMTTGGN